MCNDGPWLSFLSSETVSSTQLRTMCSSSARPTGRLRGFTVTPRRLASALSRSQLSRASSSAAASPQSSGSKTAVRCPAFAPATSSSHATRQVQSAGAVAAVFTCASLQGLHRDFAFLLYSDYLVDKPSEASVKKMIDEAVSIERSFFSDALPCSMLGMNARSMSQYVEYVADHLLDKMGLSPLYEVANPFAFMVNISLPGKTNMFERQVTEYKKPNDFVDPAAEDFVLNADV